MNGNYAEEMQVPVENEASSLVKILLRPFCRSIFEVVTLLASSYPGCGEEFIIKLCSQARGSTEMNMHLLKMLEPVIPYPIEEIDKQILKSLAKHKSDCTFLLYVASHWEWLRMFKAIFLKVQAGQIVYTNVSGTWMGETQTVEFYSIYKVGLYTVMIGIRESCENPPKIQIYGTTVDSRVHYIQSFDNFEYYVLNTANLAEQEKMLSNEN